MGSQVKSEQAKKMETVKELHQLKLKVEKFEREKSTHVYNKHSEFYREFQTMQDMDLKMEKERRTQRKSFEQVLQKLKSQVAKFRREVKEVKPTPEFVEKLKVIMEDIESQITNVKENQREQYEELMREERITSQEVLAIEKRIESWSQIQGAGAGAGGGRGSTKPTSLPSHRDVHRDLPPEVTAFERFEAQTGGPKGGWDEYDHGTFLKYRNRHKGKASFLQELVMSLPTRTEREIRQHEAWFQEHQMLNDRKKEAIAKWREQKQLEKDVPEPTQEDSDEEEEDEARKARECQASEERARAKAQLNRWKVERELQKAEEEERQLRMQLEASKKKELEKQRQMEVKKRVEEYKMVKQAEENERRLVDEVKSRVEKEEKQRMAKVIISKFKDRDMESVRQKRNARQQAQHEAEEEKQRRLARLKSQVRVQADRDPSRLLQPTAGWVERQKDADTSGRGQVLHMPHRAVPTWRQNMN